jgi:hypothetical protein
VPPSCAAGADRAPVDAREAELVAEHEARAIADALEQVEAASAHGLSLTGTSDVVEALRKGQVERLVLADEPDEEELLVGGSPLQLGTTQEDMAALGVTGFQPVHGDRALLAAAAATGAAVEIVPRLAMPGGSQVAAVLRYTDASTPASR